MEDWVIIVFFICLAISIGALSKRIDNIEKKLKIENKGLSAKEIEKQKKMWKLVGWISGIFILLFILLILYFVFVVF